MGFSEYKLKHLKLKFSPFFYLCDPNRRPYRYIIALLLSCIQGIFVFCVEFPAGIQSKIIQTMEIDNTQYNLLFSAFAWCDIVMSLIGSVIIDKLLGIQSGLIMFTLIFALGQLTVSAGAYANSFVMILLGRLILGVGRGSTLSIVYSFEIKWFGGKEITFVMSLGRCMGRLGATLALIVPLLLYNLLSFLTTQSYRHGTVQMVGSFLCLCSVGFSVIVVLLDKNGSKVTKDIPANEKKYNILEIKKFPVAFWVVSLMCGTFYGVMFATTANGPLFFISRYDYSAVTAGIANSLSYSYIIVITPFIALSIDWLGYNLIWGFIGIALAISSNVLFIASRDSDVFMPFLCAALYSLSFSFFGSAIWVTISFLVPDHLVTTAYGISLSFYSLMVSLIGISSGVLIDMFGYLMLNIFYVILMFLVTYLTLFLSVSEIVSGNRVLNVSGRTRHK